MVEQSPSRVARLYFDEDADARLAEALRRRGYDVETTVAAGLLEASDEEQLTYAASQQRVLVTHNIKHFPDVHAAWIEAGKVHWGIIILIGHSAIGSLAAPNGDVAESLLSRGVEGLLAVPQR